MCWYISQLRPCPHLEQDILSDCLSMQQLQNSTSSQQLYNGKDSHSPALGPDIFTGTHTQGAGRAPKGLESLNISLSNNSLIIMI